MKNQLLPLTILLCLAAAARAQEIPKVSLRKYGTLVIQTVPPIGATVARVGDTVLQKSNRIVLLPGTYEVTLWSAYYQSVTRTVTIRGDSLHYLRERLVLSEEILAYRQARTDFNKKVFWNKVAPYAATGMLAAGSVAAWLRSWNHQKEALRWQEKYDHAVSASEVAVSKGEYQDARKIAVNSKTTMFVLSGLTVAGAYLSLKGHRKLRSLEKPVLPAQSPPFEVEGFGARLNEDNRPVFSLTLKF